MSQMSHWTLSQVCDGKRRVFPPAVSIGLRGNRRFFVSSLPRSTPVCARDPSSGLRSWHLGIWFAGKDCAVHGKIHVSFKFLAVLEPRGPSAARAIDAYHTSTDHAEFTGIAMHCCCSPRNPQHLLFDEYGDLLVVLELVLFFCVAARSNNGGRANRHDRVSKTRIGTTRPASPCRKHGSPRPVDEIGYSAACSHSRYRCPESILY